MKEWFTVPNKRYNSPQSSLFADISYRYNSKAYLLAIYNKNRYNIEALNYCIKNIQSQTSRRIKVFVVNTNFLHKNQ